MPSKKFLTLRQKESLLQALKKSDSSHSIQRILILLLRNEGKTYQEIADFLDCSYRTVAYWCVHSDPNDLESFKDKRTQGNYRKATEDYIQLLMEVVDKEPIQLGYSFKRWTGERLANHLENLTGIKLSGAQTRNLLRKNKISLTQGRRKLSIPKAVAIAKNKLSNRKVESNDKNIALKTHELISRRRTVSVGVLIAFGSVLISITAKLFML
ncbi:MAG: helix-turn-helix domain-containing protein [Hydrococcus sp. CRU_1_1]|nr:helix-turn-helix domain-containing protein [Hydrococcus sp. CRU_1_1]